MDSSAREDLLSFEIAEPPDLVQIVITAAQLSFPTLTFTGRQLSESTTVEECQLELLARDEAGHPVPQWNLGIEIYTSGTQLTVMIERLTHLEYPLLWHSQYSVWMDAQTGQKVDRPADGELVEYLVRRLSTKLIP